MCSLHILPCQAWLDTIHIIRQALPDESFITSVMQFHAPLDCCGHICTCITTLKLHSLLVEWESWWSGLESNSAPVLHVFAIPPAGKILHRYRGSTVHTDGQANKHITQQNSSGLARRIIRVVKEKPYT